VGFTTCGHELFATSVGELPCSCFARHSSLATSFRILPNAVIIHFQEKLMLYDWTTYKAELSKSIPDFAKLTPDSLKGYQTLSNANKEHSLLGAKMRELISIAVAVTTRCDGCITFHTDAALKAGATREEIAEALGVAMAMNAGAALIYSLRAMDAVLAHSAGK